jgi:hypothetical protein
MAPIGARVVHSDTGREYAGCGATPQGLERRFSGVCGTPEAGSLRVPFERWLLVQVREGTYRLVQNHRQPDTRLSDPFLHNRGCGILVILARKKM